MIQKYERVTEQRRSRKGRGQKIVLVLMALFLMLVLRSAYRQRINKEEVEKKLNSFYKKHWAQTVLDVDCRYACNDQSDGIKKYVMEMDWNKQQNLLRKFDWVQSFHSRKMFPSEIYLKNIAIHARKGAIISWSLKDSNEMSELKRLMLKVFTEFEFQFNQNQSKQFNSVSSTLGQFFIFSKIEKPIRFTERGFWEGTKGAEQQHVYFPRLKDKMIEFYKSEGAKSIVDLGCGKCEYAQNLKNAGFDATGYDGNPDTYELSQGFATSLDLSVPQNLGKKFDWVQSLQVGEHIPPQKTAIFIENIVRHAADGILLSWAIVNGGFGTFNAKSNSEVIDLMVPYGFAIDRKKTVEFRKVYGIQWFKDSFMVFRKQK